MRYTGEIQINCDIQKFLAETKRLIENDKLIGELGDPIRQPFIVSLDRVCIKILKVYLKNWHLLVDFENLETTYGRQLELFPLNSLGLKPRYCTNDKDDVMLIAIDVVSNVNYDVKPIIIANEEKRSNNTTK